MATPSEMASNVAKQATSIGMEAATLALRLADAECKTVSPGAPLSEDEKDEIVTRARKMSWGSMLDIADSWKAIDAALAKRNTAQPERISALLKQRDQLDAIARNPDWILAPDGMTAEQHIAAGGRFADPRGVIHTSMQGDKDEMWLWVLPNPKVSAQPIISQPPCTVCGGDYVDFMVHGASMPKHSAAAVDDYRSAPKTRASDGGCVTLCRRPDRGTRKGAEVIYEGRMDPECVVLCDAMNTLFGIVTRESCCGHGVHPFRVWFSAGNFSQLKPILNAIHGLGWDWHRWHVEATGYPAAEDVYFLLEGPVNGQYQAAAIAACLKEQNG